MRLVFYIITALIFAGRLMIAPRLANVPSAGGAYEASAHVVVGALLFAPLYDWRQRLGPSRLYGALGVALTVWEGGMFLFQRFQ